MSKSLKIGDLEVKIPVVQGGMGVESVFQDLQEMSLPVAGLV